MKEKKVSPSVHYSLVVYRHSVWFMSQLFRSYLQKDVEKNIFESRSKTGITNYSVRYHMCSILISFFCLFFLDSHYLYREIYSIPKSVNLTALDLCTPIRLTEFWDTRYKILVRTFQAA